MTSCLATPSGLQAPQSQSSAASTILRPTSCVMRSLVPFLRSPTDLAPHLHPRRDVDVHRHRHGRRGGLRERAVSRPRPAVCVGLSVLAPNSLPRHTGHIARGAGGPTADPPACAAEGAKRGPGQLLVGKLGGLRWVSCPPWFAASGCTAFPEVRIDRGTARICVPSFFLALSPSLCEHVVHAKRDED